MSKAQRVAAVRGILERATALRDLCRAHGDAVYADEFAKMAVNAEIELTFLENGWESGAVGRVYALPACDCRCRDCDHP